MRPICWSPFTYFLAGLGKNSHPSEALWKGLLFIFKDSTTRLMNTKQICTELAVTIQVSAVSCLVLMQEIKVLIRSEGYLGL